jgi:hypothetical protein
VRSATLVTSPKTTDRFEECGWKEHQGFSTSQPPRHSTHTQCAAGSTHSAPCWTDGDAAWTTGTLGARVVHGGDGIPAHGGWCEWWGCCHEGQLQQDIGLCSVACARGTVGCVISRCICWCHGMRVVWWLGRSIAALKGEMWVGGRKGQSWVVPKNVLDFLVATATLLVLSPTDFRFCKMGFGPAAPTPPTLGRAWHNASPPPRHATRPHHHQWRAGIMPYPMGMHDGVCVCANRSKISFDSAAFRRPLAPMTASHVPPSDDRPLDWQAP